MRPSEEAAPLQRLQELEAKLAERNARVEAQDARIARLMTARMRKKATEQMNALKNTYALAQAALQEYMSLAQKLEGVELPPELEAERAELLTSPKLQSMGVDVFQAHSTAALQLSEQQEQPGQRQLRAEQPTEDHEQQQHGEQAAEQPQVGQVAEQQAGHPEEHEPGQAWGLPEQQQLGQQPEERQWDGPEQEAEEERFAAPHAPGSDAGGAPHAAAAEAWGAEEGPGGAQDGGGGWVGEAQDGWGHADGLEDGGAAAYSPAAAAEGPAEFGFALLPPVGGEEGGTPDLLIRPASPRPEGAAQPAGGAGQDAKGEAAAAAGEGPEGLHTPLGLIGGGLGGGSPLSPGAQLARRLQAEALNTAFPEQWTASPEAEWELDTAQGTPSAFLANPEFVERATVLAEELAARRRQLPLVLQSMSNRVEQGNLVVASEGDEVEVALHLQKRNVKKRDLCIIMGALHAGNWDSQEPEVLGLLAALSAGFGSFGDAKELAERLLYISKFRLLGYYTATVIGECALQAACGGDDGGSLPVLQWLADSPFLDVEQAGKGAGMFAVHSGNGSFKFYVTSAGMAPCDTAQAGLPIIEAIRTRLAGTWTGLMSGQAWADGPADAPVVAAAASPAAAAGPAPAAAVAAAGHAAPRGGGGRGGAARARGGAPRDTAVPPPEFYSQLQRLPKLAVDTGTCDGVLLGTSLAEMRKAIALVVAGYRAMACPSFADEQRLAEEAQALLRDYGDDMEHYRLRLLSGNDS